MAIRTVPVAPKTRVRRSDATSDAMSGELTVVSSACQRATAELGDRRRAAITAA
jgi:hypothetical protein